jgi:hypothetical protein
VSALDSMRNIRANVTESACDLVVMGLVDASRSVLDCEDNNERFDRPFLKR